ncbi:DUF6124 family protein [Pseudomonas thivervalensis]|uniref:DUF6124 family protein n=1 Tax=Pseudomonas thivervalensis TaxID=86265 RepID=UPI003D64A0C5
MLVVMGGALAGINLPPNIEPCGEGACSRGAAQQPQNLKSDDCFAAEREQAPSPQEPCNLFTVVNGVDTETLLANLSENLASANAMVSDLAFDLKGSRRHVALGIQQLIELSSLLANRALDNVEPRQST